MTTTPPAAVGTRRTRNPFCHSNKTLLQTTQPLRPHRVPGDEVYIVDIDHTGDCLETFEREVTLDAVRLDGGLVLACGEAGSGKTTLLHRCVKRMQIRAEAEARGCRLLVVDLGKQRPTPPSIGVRTQTLYRSVVKSLQAKPQRVLEPERLEELLGEVIPPGTSPDEPLPSDAYLRLSLYLDSLAEEWSEPRRADVVLVILLPPFQELPAEIEFYQGQLVPRLLFLGETRNTDPPRTGRETVLTIDPITEADVWEVAEQRLSMEHPVDFPPYTTREDVVAYFGDDWHLGFATAQLILLHAFEDALHNHPSLDRLTFEHFARSTLKIVRPGMIRITP
jgi:hypothetical protein